MDWKALIASVCHTKSIVNAFVMFCAGYGAAVLLHLPGHIYLGLGAVIVNQIGLHQAAPGGA